MPTATVHCDNYRHLHVALALPRPGAAAPARVHTCQTAVWLGTERRSPARDGFTVNCRALISSAPPHAANLVNWGVGESLADDPTLHNPLQRQERLGTGWFGIIIEYEGVLVESTSSLHTAAWEKLADEEGKSTPFLWALKRTEGMKAEQVVSELFHWTRNPMEIRRLAQRKDEIYAELLGDRKPALLPGALSLLENLLKNQIPVAVVSNLPERRLLDGLEYHELGHYFDAIVGAEDTQFGRPDPEPYLWAAQQLSRPTARCIVVGDSNSTVTAAKDVGMQCVTVASHKPVYELTAADLVVRELGELSFVNLKRLFREEQTLEPVTQAQLEPEPELPATDLFA